MTQLSRIIKQDAIKQIVTGLIMAVLTLGLIIITFVITAQWQIIFLIASLGIASVSFLKSGSIDLAVAKNTQLRMKAPEENKVTTTWPRRMFIEHQIGNVSTLLDMDETKYLSIFEQKQSKIKLILDIVTETVSIRHFLPKRFRIEDYHGNRIFYLEKKGGFNWRSYVFDETGKGIAYLDSSKQDKHIVLQYIDNDGVRWQASKDGIGFITIQDSEGIGKVIMKPNAIPIESERFAKANGSLIIWYDSVEIPYSLIILLFAITKKS
ncbi:hypothetical protein [Aquibacillus rhizosphaerae]|uniref:DUF58 domain-containing protein n=1 Tax=Aquibacillus rhizosphaerae TaxID=3051431 RepID=A0ABT7L292_9BACI|nr:hypothetical protein [Aquibacillus sp. LR5S19]MDL4839285.1 hypothetical protein [Aquibacillus sp. LR5S19]